MKTAQTMALSNRLQNAVLERFNGDKRKAIVYLRKQRTFFAYKADRMHGSMTYQGWRNVWEAYTSASYALEYYLDLETEEDMFCQEPF